MELVVYSVKKANLDMGIFLCFFNLATDMHDFLYKFRTCISIFAKIEYA
jgi:hypothetical protein